MALPEFPQIIDRDSVQQTPHGQDESSSIDGVDDAYGYANPLDGTRPMKTSRRNPALMDEQANPAATASQGTVKYRETL